MTNAEVLMNVLNDIIHVEKGREPELLNIDYGGAIDEREIHYHINCPYRNSKGLCADKKYEINRTLCAQCKYQWLLSEYEYEYEYED